MGAWLERSVAALAVTLAACAVTAADSVPAGQAENAPPAHLGSGQVSAGAAAAVTLLALEAALRADAAQWWRVAHAQGLKTVSSEVIWADGALGCPRPGQFYTQALEPGWRIVIGEAGRQLIYHASRRGSWVRCERAVATIPMPPRTVDR